VTRRGDDETIASEELVPWLAFLAYEGETVSEGELSAALGVDRVATRDVVIHGAEIARRVMNARVARVRAAVSDGAPTINAKAEVVGSPPSFARYGEMRLHDRVRRIRCGCAEDGVIVDYERNDAGVNLTVRFDNGHNGYVAAVHSDSASDFEVIRA